MDGVNERQGVIKMAYVDYPSHFPTPLIAGYQDVLTSGLKRTSMEAGNWKHRRARWTLPETFTLTFAVPYGIYKEWHQWIAANAWEWFNLPLLNTLSTANERCYAREVRFATDLQTSMGGGDFVLVAVIAEALGVGINDLNNDRGWVIAGRPDNPSSDWIIAGRPDAPSDPDWVLAGTPEAPADYI